jgi:hypothetical protein
LSNADPGLSASGDENGFGALGARSVARGPMMDAFGAKSVESREIAQK